MSIVAVVATAVALKIIHVTVCQVTVQRVMVSASSELIFVSLSKNSASVFSSIQLVLTVLWKAGNEIFTVLLDNLTHPSRRHFKHQ